MQSQKLLAIATLIVTLPVTASAQNTKAEQEVRAFIAEYDQAVASRDIAFLEPVMPDDYVFAGASGRKSDRAQVLKFFAQQRDKPSEKMISLKHEDMVVRSVDNSFARYLYDSPAA